MDDYNSWKLLISRYETRMSKRIDDEVKSAILLRQVPADIKAHLGLDAERLGYTFEQLCAQVVSYLQVSVNFRDTGRAYDPNANSSSSSSGPTPMDVDAVMKGGKGAKGACFGLGGRGRKRGKMGMFRIVFHHDFGRPQNTGKSALGGGGWKRVQMGN